MAKVASPIPAGAPTPIGPDAYASWRATTLGAITEPLETRLILDLAGKLSGRRVLDLGCGDGALVCAAAAQGAEATGIDSDAAMLEVARVRAAEAGLHVTFLQGRIEYLPFPAASFDVVTAVTVLCFVGDAAAAVREMARVLRPNSRLVVGELGRRSLWAAVRRMRGWLGSPTWKSARFRTAGELRALVEPAGFSVTEVRGAVYYPPVGVIARLMGPALDAWLGSLTSFGAAFIALGAIKVRGKRET
jgi:2-polyprenyl-3-methyl-5-hydroxy-6-metoxy-1,4-benzoquinol methylase